MPSICSTVRSMPQYNRSPPSAPRNARTINCSSTGSTSSTRLSKNCVRAWWEAAPTSARWPRRSAGQGVPQPGAWQSRNGCCRHSYATARAGHRALPQIASRSHRLGRARGNRAQPGRHRDLPRDSGSVSVARSGKHTGNGRCGRVRNLPIGRSKHDCLCGSRAIGLCRPSGPVRLGSLKPRNHQRRFRLELPMRDVVVRERAIKRILPGDEEAGM